MMRTCTTGGPSPLRSCWAHRHRTVRSSPACCSRTPRARPRCPVSHARRLLAVYEGLADPEDFLRSLAVGEADLGGPAGELPRDWGRSLGCSSACACADTAGDVEDLRHR